MRTATFFLLAAGCVLGGDLDWPSIGREQRPWTRWWWLGSAVDPENLVRELRALRDAGIGGVEITPIYGVKGRAESSPKYLSPEWIKLLQFTIEEAHRRDLGVDLPLGSGWRTGGPWITPEAANKSARIRRDPATGRYQIEIVYSRSDVKRPAPGGEGRSIDTYSAPALKAFLDVFGKALAPLPKGAIRTYFHDSFEYTGNWTPDLLDQFHERKGYRLEEHLSALLGEGDPDAVGRVQSDYREVLGLLLETRFLEGLEQFAHARGGLFRNQGHGSPANLLDVYAATDIPETEIFGRLGGADADPLISKFASSAAHVTGKKLVSSESFTWLDEHFHVTLDKMKRATDQLLLSGVNHMFFHGTAYSPADAPWPGWLFYASTQVNSRNPWWRHLPALNAYIARAQSILQAGRPGEDVLVYWPYYDVIDQPGNFFQPLRVHTPTWFRGQPAGELALNLWRRGYQFDFISDRQLRALDWKTSGYRALVVPKTRRMPPATLERIFQLSAAGAAVIIEDQLPEDVPGLANLESNRQRLAALKARKPQKVILASNIEQALEAAGVRRESMKDLGLGVSRRTHDRGMHYFLRNDSGQAIDRPVPLALPAQSVAILDPMTGAAGLAEWSAAGVRLQLEPGQSVILRTFTKGRANGQPWRYLQRAGDPIALSGAWQIRFVDGGPDLPKPASVTELASWKEWGAEAFSGVAVYTLTFDDPGAAREYLLDLGTVANSARVTVNGGEGRTLIASPFRMRIGGLRPSGNRLEVEVANLGANRIRDLDRRGQPWKIFDDINIVNIDYKPLDASGWPILDSGLLGPVQLTPLK